MLKTAWTDEALTQTPLSEYPRPQFVRDSYISLNGMWDYTVSHSDKIPTEFSGKILVPFSPETELSGVHKTLRAGEHLFYKKTFALPENFNKGRVFINFGAVDQLAKVYLNGECVGSHKGGYTAFTLELTQALNDGDNTLVVDVLDYTEQKPYSRGKQRSKRGGIWYTPQSGIWQSVWLESTPEQYLKSVKITPDYDKAEVRFDYEGTDDVIVKIFDGGDLLAECRENVVKLPDFKSWSPDDPFLYKVEFNACGERIKSYFGMRKFSLGEDEKGVKRLFLNNKPFFHNGLLDQGYYPDGYLTPPSNKAMENDVRYVKRAGFNMLRKHIKIEPLLWYHYCDVNGIIVWQDMVNGGGKYGLEISAIPFVGIKLDDTDYKNFHREDEEGRALYWQELEEEINYLYNCPCIAMWVPFNEGWGQFDSAKAYEKIKALDSTRLVDSASGWHDMGVSDVISKHIYFTPIKVKTGDRAYVLSEFGGFSHRVKGHTFNDKMFGYKIYKTPQSLEKAYKRLFNRTIIPQLEAGLSATVYTQVTDVEDELNGLLTYDRAVEKIDIKTLQEINSRLKL